MESEFPDSDEVMYTLAVAPNQQHQAHVAKGFQLTEAMTSTAGDIKEAETFEPSMTPIMVFNCVQTDEVGNLLFDDEDKAYHLNVVISPEGIAAVAKTMAKATTCPEIWHDILTLMRLHQEVCTDPLFKRDNDD